MVFAPKDDKTKTSGATPLAAALQPLSINNTSTVVSDPASQVVPAASKSPQVDEEEELDEELDKLLGLEKPTSGDESVAAPEEQRVDPEEGECLHFLCFYFLCLAALKKSLMPSEMCLFSLWQNCEMRGWRTLTSVPFHAMRARPCLGCQATRKLARLQSDTSRPRK